MEHLQPAGLLQPLPIRTQIWTDILMDFVECLPLSHGNMVLLFWWTTFLKYAHFVPLGHPYTAPTVARISFYNVFKLHWLLEPIVSDQDMTFTRNFGKELSHLSGVKFSFSCCLSFLK